MGWRQKLDTFDDDLTDREVEQALDWVDSLSERAGSKAREFIESLRIHQDDLRRQENAIQRAWERGEWQELADERVISQDDADLADEILARYS